MTEVFTYMTAFLHVYIFDIWLWMHKEPKIRLGDCARIFFSCQPFKPNVVHWYCSVFFGRILTQSLFEVNHDINDSFNSPNDCIFTLTSHVCFSHLLAVFQISQEPDVCPFVKPKCSVCVDVFLGLFFFKAKNTSKKNLNGEVTFWRRHMESAVVYQPQWHRFELVPVDIFLVANGEFFCEMILWEQRWKVSESILAIIGFRFNEQFLSYFLWHPNVYVT